MTKPLACLSTGALLFAAAAASPAAVSAGAGSPQPGKVARISVTFAGTEYAHRWSKDGQNEFTPAGDEDLSQWKDMLTINVHDGVHTGDELAELANRVLGNYAAHGKVLRTDSRPRTKEAEAEHFASVVLGQTGLREVAFARVLLAEKQGVVVVRSRRFYGPDVSQDMLKWLGDNGAKVEAALMSWKAMPTIASLKALPQAKK